MGNYNERRKSLLEQKMEVEEESIDDILIGEDKEKLKYLVSGAILTCDKATTDVKILRGTPFGYKSKKEFEERKKTRLFVSENPIDDNGRRFATVKNHEKGINIEPFECNCQCDPTEVEIDMIFEAENLEECQTLGTCRKLMKLEDDWENLMCDTTKRLFGYQLEGEEAEGIYRQSVLFCSHGGFIYPLTSGQSEETIENIYTELEEKLLAKFTDYSFEKWPLAKQECAKEIWEKFYFEEGWDAYFVAGLIGNMYGEGSCGKLQGKDGWEEFKDDYDNAICKKGMIITNIEQAKVACLVATETYGVGMVQWSALDRKKDLYMFYQKNQSDDGTLSTEQLLKAEIEMIYYELDYGGRFGKIYPTCEEHFQSSNDADSNITYAAAIIYRIYEAPSGRKVVDNTSYKISEDVWKEAENANKGDDLHSICQRVITAKVAYEYFMYGDGVIQ